MERAGNEAPERELPGGEGTMWCVTGERKRYLELLLLADEQESMIDRYLERGEMFVLRRGGETVAVCVVTMEGGGTCELKNLAVAPGFQCGGLGRAVVGFLAKRYRGRCREMLVGTGESRATLGFYESCGFRRSHRVKDFFTDNYDKPIFEEGKRLRDMIYLRKEL